MNSQYESIARLWSSFHDLMRGHQEDNDESLEEQPQGLPGTGGHVLSVKQDNQMSDSRRKVRDKKVPQSKEHT